MTSTLTPRRERLRALDLALRVHAAELDGSADLHAALTEHLAEQVDAHRLIAAALLHTSWAGHSDTLAEALTDVADADHRLGSKTGHDGRCGIGDYGQCDRCDDLRKDALDNALGYLRSLLGDSVCDDLAAAVTA